MKNFLLIASLLLAACTKGAEPIPNTSFSTPVASENTIRYSLDGASYSKPATVKISSFTSTAGLVRTVAVIGYTESSTGNPEYVQVYYNQKAGAALDAPYVLVALYLESKLGRPAYTTNLVGKVAKAGTRWQGTFAGSGPKGVISNGEFKAAE